MRWAIRSRTSASDWTPSALGIISKLRNQGCKQRGTPGLRNRVVHTKTRTEFPIRPGKAARFGFARHKGCPARAGCHIRLGVGSELAHVYRQVVLPGPVCHGVEVVGHCILL